MIDVFHQYIKMNDDYRCIIISDIHSHFDRFQELLESLHYNHDDYLIINGDFVEKGTQTKQVIDFLRQLQKESDRVFVILGNCEYALETLVSDPAFSKQMLFYLKKIGKSGLIDQTINKLSLDIDFENHEYIQKRVKEEIKEELDYLRSLPTSLETDDFLCVHAGIEKRKDWKNSSRSSFIEMRSFQKEGHLLDKYVIVGHLPTSNFNLDDIKNDIVFDKEKKIISIDGGTGVKAISQLNALIIEKKDGHLSFTQKYRRSYPFYKVIKDVKYEEKTPHKIAWPHFEVEILERHDQFSRCRQVDTEKIFWIKNEFLYQRNNKIYCLDDYVDTMLSLKKDDIVELAGIYDQYAYVIHKDKIGWVKIESIHKKHDD